MQHLNNFKTWNYDITWGIIFMMNTYISVSEDNISNILRLKKTENIDRHFQLQHTI